jgi:hypothetical protein
MVLQFNLIFFQFPFSKCVLVNCLFFYPFTLPLSFFKLAHNVPGLGVVGFCGGPSAAGKPITISPCCGQVGY